MVPPWEVAWSLALCEGPVVSFRRTARGEDWEPAYCLTCSGVASPLHVTCAESTSATGNSCIDDVECKDFGSTYDVSRHGEGLEAAKLATVLKMERWCLGRV